MNWDKVTVGQLPEVYKLTQFHTSDLVELFDRDVALISIFTGYSEDYINGMTPAEFGKLRTELYALLQKEPQAEFSPVLKVGGRKFVFIASARNVTVKELAEIQLLKIDQDNFYSNIPIVISVFAKEVNGLKFWKKKLSFTERVELFKSLPAPVGNGIALFFCRVLPILERGIENYLAKAAQKAIRTIKENQLPLKNGGGLK